MSWENLTTVLGSEWVNRSREKGNKYLPSFNLLLQKYCFSYQDSGLFHQYLFILGWKCANVFCLYMFTVNIKQSRIDFGQHFGAFLTSKPKRSKWVAVKPTTDRSCGNAWFKLRTWLRSGRALKPSHKQNCWIIEQLNIQKWTPNGKLFQQRGCGERGSYSYKNKVLYLYGNAGFNLACWLFVKHESVSALELDGLHIVNLHFSLPRQQIIGQACLQVIAWREPDIWIWDLVMWKFLCRCVV